MSLEMKNLTLRGLPVASRNTRERQIGVFRVGEMPHAGCGSSHKNVASSMLLCLSVKSKSFRKVSRDGHRSARLVTPGSRQEETSVTLPFGQGSFLADRNQMTTSVLCRTSLDLQRKNRGIIDTNNRPFFSDPTSPTSVDGFSMT